MAVSDDAPEGTKGRNPSRFFVEHRQIAWVLLVANLAWGCFGYFSMPQRKDPAIAMRRSLVTVVWPGASARQVQDLVTIPLERAVSLSNSVAKIESVSRPGAAFITVSLDEYLPTDMDKAFDDVKIKLDQVHGLPPGAGPIQYEKDVGDTAALTLSIASPPATPLQVALRAAGIQRAILAARRAATGPPRQRFTLVYCLPSSLSLDIVTPPLRSLAQRLEARGMAADVRVIGAPGFVGLDGASVQSDTALLAQADGYLEDDLNFPSLHPDIWEPALIRDPGTTARQLAAVAGPEYSDRQLDDASELIGRTFQAIPSVSKVTRTGLVPEVVSLFYSQDRLAALGLRPGLLPAALNGQNVAADGATLDAQGRRVRVGPPLGFQTLADIGAVAVGTTAAGAPVPLRDVADIERSDQDPPQALDHYDRQDAQGRWQRDRAVTLAVYMRPAGDIAQTGRAVDAALASLRTRLPPGLIVARISDQPQQVRESIGLFTETLWQAVVLVILVSLIGFREWRSALLMACAIPLTLAMALGLMALLGMDLQQVSIVSLIIALGLLVDDPVVAGDAIKRELNAGRRPDVAAWLGPTKLGTAIAFATLTNIVAYLPFLTLKGDAGRFLFSLPVVMTCALAASRVVSLTFVPFLGQFLLRAAPEKNPPAPNSGGTNQGGQPRGAAPTSGSPRIGGGGGNFQARYRRVVAGCIRHRKAFVGGSLLLLAAGGIGFAQLRQSFFPYDSQYLSYVEINLPEDASLAATDRVAARAERIIEDVTARAGVREGTPGHPKRVLVSLAVFVGHASPRFWFTVFPQEPHPNYAMIVVHMADKADTRRLQFRIQDALTAGIPEARLDVHQLETGRPIGIPVALRITGDDPVRLRQIADSVERIYQDIPIAARVRDDWGSDGLRLQVRADPDRAALAGVTEQDIADAQAGLAGVPVGVLRDGDTQIPIVARLRLADRARLTDLNDLYVFSSRGPQRVPLSQVATVTPVLEPLVLRRRNQFPCITVYCFPTEGHIASEVDAAAQSALDRLAATLPPGYSIEQGGEIEEQNKAFLQLVGVMAISVACIYLALLFEFRSVVKPLLVFAAVPYGMVGAVIGLRVMGEPFGFMAFLGIISLIGVLVSHIIVLFDYIEAAHKRGEALETALLDAGVQRLRPILITVGATVIAFVPLALHGGPLWEPLCYAQIGGLLVGACTTLFLVPCLYTIFVRDWKILTWERADQEVQPDATASNVPAR